VDSAIIAPIYFIKSRIPSEVTDYFGVLPVAVHDARVRDLSTSPCRAHWTSIIGTYVKRDILYVTHARRFGSVISRVKHDVYNKLIYEYKTIHYNSI